jgi:hypothetical protein
MILVVVRWAYLFVEEVCLKCGNPAGVPVVRLENCCWKLRAGHKDGLFVILHNIHYAQFVVPTKHMFVSLPLSQSR